MTILLALLLLVPPSPTEWTYSEALKQATNQHRPLMVVVTAKWCAPCQVLKRDTILPMRDDEDLENAVLVIIDKDEQPNLAKEIMKGEDIPQTVVYSRKSGQWKRFSICGLVSRSKITELLKRAIGQ